MPVPASPVERLAGTPLSRRSFVAWSTAVAGSAALVGCTSTPPPEEAPPAGPDGRGDVDRTVWSACVINCGSRCPLRLQVKDGVIVRVLPDNTGDDDLMTRQIRACPRGRSMRQRIYNADRIKKPMLRKPGTKRGGGEWVDISWDEAFDLVAEKLKYTIEKYGNAAIFKNYGSGVWNAHFATSGGWGRLLNLLGGYLGYYGNYSYAQIATCTRFSYGVPDEMPSNSFEDTAKNSRLLVLWGNNPQETRMSGGGLVFTSLWAKQNAKVRIIVVDPRHTDSVSLLADQWIPIRPGTDAALVAAMVHEMISQDLHDQEFLDRYVQGFDEDHMPPGVPPGHSYRSYVMGEGPDGIAKTPEWAAPITGIPAAVIRQFAVEVATTKPAAITQGWGPQRHANGENQARAIYALAAITGNIGIPGGGTGGREGYFWPQSMWFPDGENPVKARISCYGWTDAIERGPEMTALADGVRGVDRLETGIKFMLNYGGNMLSSQHGDINRTRKLLEDESKCEFIVVIDNQMTGSADMADLVLPDTTPAERWDLVPSEYTGDMAYLIMGEKAIEPLFDSRPAYEMCREIAKRFGKEAEFTEGRDMEGWVRWMQAQNVAAHPHFPSFDELRSKGVHRYYNPDGLTVPLKEFRADPDANPLDTPSGKIEIFSSVLWEMKHTWTFDDPLPGDVITPLPEYTATWEGAEEAKTNKAYPLQMISHHFKGRTHSSYGNIPWLHEAHPQKAWINPLDAAARGVVNEEPMEVFNDRGRIRVRAFVTPRIMPGVVSVPQGAWYRMEDGVDVGGAANTLTSWHPTPQAKGNGQHTVLVQVEKAKGVV